MFQCDCGSTEVVLEDWVPRSFPVQLCPEERVASYNPNDQRLHWDGCSNMRLRCAKCASTAVLPDGWLLREECADGYDEDSIEPENAAAPSDWDVDPPLRYVADSPDAPV